MGQERFLTEDYIYWYRSRRSEDLSISNETAFALLDVLTGHDKDALGRLKRVGEDSSNLAKASGPTRPLAKINR